MGDLERAIHVEQSKAASAGLQWAQSSVDNLDQVGGAAYKVYSAVKRRMQRLSSEQKTTASLSENLLRTGGQRELRPPEESGETSRASEQAKSRLEQKMADLSGKTRSAEQETSSAPRQEPMFDYNPDREVAKSDWERSPDTNTEAEEADGVSADHSSENNVDNSIDWRNDLSKSNQKPGNNSDKQKTVIEISSAVSSSNTQVELQSSDNSKAPENGSNGNSEASSPDELALVNIYRGELFTIEAHGNSITITETGSDEPIFKYEYVESRDGNMTAKVTLDDLTKNRELYKHFENASQNLQSLGGKSHNDQLRYVNKLQSHPSRRAETETLGALARQGSRAVAAGELATKDRPTHREYIKGRTYIEFTRISNPENKKEFSIAVSKIGKDSDGNPIKPADSLITQRTNDGNIVSQSISTREAKENYSHLSSVYVKEAQAFEKNKANEELRAEGKPIPKESSRRDEIER